MISFARYLTRPTCSKSKMLQNLLFCRTIGAGSLGSFNGNADNISGLTKSQTQSLSTSLSGDDNQEAPQKRLFTPGPLGVSYETKKVMLRDLGSRDIEFMDTVKFIRSKLLEIANLNPDQYTAVPLQGSGTYAVEAVFQTTVPRNNGKVLIMANGAYGRRMNQIINVLQYDKIFLEGAEYEKADLNKIEEILKSDKSITNVAIVHCETSSGVIHPVEEVGELVAKHAPQATFFVDAMSSFGGVPLDLQKANIDFLVSSANKCIEGVPGFSFVIARKDKLLQCEGCSRSLSLDIVDQYFGLEKTGQFRFTPPTHSMLAFKKALSELEVEGGIEGRSSRYKANRELLRNGMKEMGFKEFLDDSHTGYIITSFRYPAHPKFNFQDFYDGLNMKGQVIYPGKVTKEDCFRIGNIGHLFPEDMKVLLQCIRQVCEEMNISLPLEE